MESTEHAFDRETAYVGPGRVEVEGRIEVRAGVRAEGEVVDGVAVALVGGVWSG